MGWSARANPRSAEGKSEREALNARLRRFAEFFALRADYEAYLTDRGVTDAERVYLEQFLPAHLQQQTAEIAH